jgi:hypothetical protein
MKLQFLVAEGESVLAHIQIGNTNSHYRFPRALGTS